jgi:hypothetical protein
MSGIPRTVFIGYDPREHSAYNVASASILRRSEGVLIHPLHTPLLRTCVDRKTIYKDGRLWCPISDAPMSTAFANTRFAVPFIQKEGWALFVDCDIVCLADINELFDLADDKYAVMVVKHNIGGSGKIKMDGQVQTEYSRKNWSSVCLWNTSHKSHLRLRSADRINRWPGRDLHAFKWLEDDEIGELPSAFNYLVGIDPMEEASKAKIMHFTLGHPGLPNWEYKPLDEVWNTEKMLCSFR